MKRSILLLALLVLAGPAFASEETPREKKPGFFSRLLHPFGHSGHAPEAKAKPGWRQLALTMTLDPQPLKLSETRQLKVTLQLTNRSKRFAQLEFPTSQRFEVVVKNINGKLVEQWSESRSFNNTPGIVSINSGERLEYTAMVSTRDLVAGEPYTVEGFFPHYEALRVIKALNPQK